jgi:hypothetical protein
MSKGNHTGVKWSLGGKKSRNKLQMELDGFAQLLVDFEEIGGNLQEAVTDAIEQASETIGEDTEAAVAKAYLPAEGRYSEGNTAETVVKSPKAEWSGTVVECGIGFDKTKKGAGGFLITGTPRMRPDWELEKIYVQKKYFRNLQKDMCDVVNDYISMKKKGGLF